MTQFACGDETAGIFFVSFPQCEKTMFSFLQGLRVASSISLVPLEGFQASTLIPLPPLWDPLVSSVQ